MLPVYATALDCAPYGRRLSVGNERETWKVEFKDKTRLRVKRPPSSLRKSNLVVCCVLSWPLCIQLKSVAYEPHRVQPSAIGSLLLPCMLPTCSLFGGKQ